MNNKPLISVIVPVYNGEGFVRETIESVLSQTYDNFEFIIVDDCSTDKSREIINSYNDNRIKTIFPDKNGNICVASNLAFKAATGKYIALIGHDDIWLNHKLEVQVKFMEENPDITGCFSNMILIDENSNEITDERKDYYDFVKLPSLTQEGWIITLLTTGNQLSAPSALFRTSTFKKVGGHYRNTLLQTQDYDLWLRLLSQGNIFLFDEPLVKYRRFSDNQTNLSSVNQESITRTAHEKNYIVYKFIMDYMDEELFKRVFKEHLKHPNFHGEVALLCEKAIILLSLENCFAFKLLMDLYDKEDAKEYLENSCNFPLKSFYQYNSGPIKCDEVYYMLCMQQMELLKQFQG